MSRELTREYISELRKIIEVRNDQAAIEKLEQLHPADIAEIYENISLEEATYLFLLLDPQKAADVLVELEEDDREKFLEALPSEVIASQFIGHMDSDDAADVIGDLTEDKKQEVLLHIDDVEQALRETGLEPYQRRQQGDWIAIEARRLEN